MTPINIEPALSADRSVVLAVEIQLLPHACGVPKAATPGSAAVDLCAALHPQDKQEIAIEPGAVAMIPTGIAIKLPSPNLVGLIYPRSGVGTKQGLVLANGTGVIDSDYRGEIMVALWNRGNTTQHVTRGMRIAQMVISPIYQPHWMVVPALSPDEANERTGGFGSTGTDTTPETKQEFYERFYDSRYSPWIIQPHEHPNEPDDATDTVPEGQ